MTVRSNVDLDVLNPDLYKHGDPHAAWRWLRENDPIHWYEGPLGGRWLVTKHADVASISKDHELWTSAKGNLADEPVSKEFVATALVAIDPPLHLHVRRVVSPMFTNKSLKQLEERITDVSRRLIDDALAEGEADLEEMSLSLVVDILAHVLGAPAEEIAAMVKFSRIVDNPDERELNPDPARLAASRGGAAGELMRYALSYVLGMRKPVRPGLISSILDAHAAGELNEQNALDQIGLFLSAGHEAPHDALAFGLLALLQHPGEMDRLRNDRSLMPTAVEEALRWSTPVNHFARVATRDTTLRGTMIRAGERVVLFYGSANRDAEVFEDPFRFDVARAPNPHLAFGIGVHHCLGAGLARLQMRIFFSEWLDRVKQTEVVGIERLRSHWNIGALRIPIRVR